MDAPVTVLTDSPTGWTREGTTDNRMVTTRSNNSRNLDSAISAALFGLATPVEIVRAAPYVNDVGWPPPDLCERSVTQFRHQLSIELLGQPLRDPAWQPDEDCRVLCLQHGISGDYLRGEAHLRWLEPKLAEERGFEILRVATRGRLAAKAISTMITALDEWWRDRSTGVAQKLAAYYIWYDAHGGDNGDAEYLSPWGAAHTVEQAFLALTPEVPDSWSLIRDDGTFSLHSRKR